MRFRIARLGVLFASVLGLLGVLTPPASATQVGTLAFVGEATLAAPIGYPCAPPGTTGPKCPPQVSTTTKPGKKGLTEVNLTLPNRTGFRFSSTACLYAGVAIAKPDKPVPVEAATCVIRAEGTVEGFCGLSQGIGTASIDTVALVGASQTFNASIKFTGVGGTLVVHGSLVGKRGWIWAVVEAVPPPTVTVGPPPSLGNSCSAKTATQFTIAGSAFVIEKTPPL